MSIVFENRDCMDAMREFEDGFFDLAIVDPPYGIGLLSMTFTKNDTRMFGNIATQRRDIENRAIGTNDRTGSILTNCAAYQSGRSYGATTTSRTCFHRQRALLYGISAALTA